MHDRIKQAIADELAELRAAGRLRQRPVIDGPDGRIIHLRGPQGRRKLINWGSNDYLGMATDLQVRNAAIKAVRSIGAGAGAARLLAGGLRGHRRLEQRLARFWDVEDVLLTTTGYQANLAVWTALAGANDAIVLDRLAHASTYDGARLAGATIRRFAHNDVADLERVLTRCSDARRVLVGIESVYSMDGDEAPLAEIAAVCERHGALLVLDEAHALGVLGTAGRGLADAVGVVPDVRIATASKALGSQGGLIGGSSELIELILNRGRSFIFSTAPVPAAVAAADRVLKRLMTGEDDAPAQVLAKAAQVRQGLRAAGCELVPGRTPIIPVIIGGEEAVLARAAALADAGHYVPAVRPPTVPPGGCRLRITVTAAHRDADVRRLVAAIQS